MNDGGYSRLEKDFLGNERMVHYDASGNMLGASDVQREPDGTIRISNDQGPLTVEPDLPRVEAIAPEPKATTSIDGWIWAEDKYADEPSRHVLPSCFYCHFTADPWRNVSPSVKWY